MGSIVRNAVLAGAAIVLCAAGTAQASPEMVVKAKVTFPFIVNGQQFPAGTYEIRRDDLLSSVLLIRNQDAKHETFVTTIRDGGRDPDVGAALTFKRYENGYRLASVWESDGEGWDLPSR